MNNNQNVVDFSALTGKAFDQEGGECEIHGGYTALVLKGMGAPAECPDCMQQRIRTERQEEATHTATLAQARGRKQRVGRIDLPPRMADVRWRDYEPVSDKAANFKTICQRFATDWSNTYLNGANLIMSGMTGNGKTHLASVLCKQVAAEHEVQPLYVTVSQMLRYIRASFGKGCGYTEGQAVDRFARADLLVIDEVGVKLSSDFDKATLFEIIDIRYQERLPTVVISNLSVDEINEIDERMVDRLSENGTLMLFDWDSYRGASA